ncbi:hypothetical protein FJY63_11190 [Candidatus Sumerlaeota bacterium]|nr:hypothetical protein [Candidatus Sumerlaeota bacterium]
MATSKKTPHKKKEEYKSPFEPIEDVVKAAEECKRLIDVGVITLELRYPNDVRFRIDEEKYKSLGKTESEDKRFRALLRDEVIKGLISALTDDIYDVFPPPAFLDLPREGHGKYKTDAEAIKERVGAVLCDEDLRSWHQIKSGAKMAVLQSVDWEINVKKAERGSGLIKDAPHAIVRLCVRRPVGKTEFPRGVPLFILADIAGRGETEFHVLDLHEQDVRNLIADLNRALRALEAARSQE